MIKIGVVSDTHIPRAAKDLPAVVYEKFKGADMILHAGDLVEIGVIERLEKIAPTRAVTGNMDNAEVKASLPEKDIIELGGFKIGLIHGFGPQKSARQAVSREFDNVDVIIFGHSHAPCNEKIGDTLFFNPGSPTDKVFAAFNSFGLLYIDDEPKGEIIRL